MRVGQKNALVRQWAARGSRPRQVRDLRTASAYLFGAICPERGEGAALVLPRADTEGMALHLAEIGRAVAPTPSSSPTRPDGTPPTGSRRRPTSRWYPCRPSLPNSIRLRTSGSTFARRGSPTGSSPTTRPSSTPAAAPGTISWTDPGKSCPSASANGPAPVSIKGDWYNALLRCLFYSYVGSRSDAYW